MTGNEYENRNALHYDLPPALLRQRRNLMAISLVLAFLSLANATVSDVSLPGVSIKTESSWVLWLFVWLLFVYFFIRYLQYFQLFRPDVIQTAFDTRLSNLVYERVETCLREEVPVYNALTHSIVFYSNPYPSFNHARKHGLTSFKIDWEYQKRSATGGEERKTTEFELTDFDADVADASRYSKAALPYVTDYYFPFIIFGLSLILGLTMNWSGSPIWGLIGLLSGR